MLYSVLLGVGISFVYDCLRICRRVVAHGIVWISLEDLLFWAFVSFCIFDLLYHENNGAFRWFAIMGAAVGMLLFKKTVSPLLVKYVSRLLLWIRRILAKLTAFLITPFRRAGRRAEDAAASLFRKAKQFARFFKKRLTVRYRMAKMILYKHSGKGSEGRNRWSGERSYSDKRRKRTE